MAVGGWGPGAYGQRRAAGGNVSEWRSIRTLGAAISSGPVGVERTMHRKLRHGNTPACDNKQVHA